MKMPKYPLASSDSLMTFEFVSEGPMGITKFLSEVNEDYEVLGELNDEWEVFTKDVEYEGFLVRRKNNE